MNIYDPRETIKLSKSLQNFSDLMQFIYCIIGAILGLIFAWISLKYLYIFNIYTENDSIYIFAIATIGCLLGYLKSCFIVFKYKYYSQHILCLGQIEENTRKSIYKEPDKINEEVKI